MMNRDRVASTLSSWIRGLATISTVLPPSAGDHPCLPGHAAAGLTPGAWCALLRVELDDELLLDRGVDHGPGGQVGHPDQEFGRIHVQPGRDHPSFGQLDGLLDRKQVSALLP